jgi:hypothetical protein
MLLKEMIPVYNENHTKPISAHCKSHRLLKQVGHIVITVASMVNCI